MEPRDGEELQRKRAPNVTEQLLRLMLEQARDHALILLDEEGRVVDWLAGSEHVFGWHRHEMLGRPLHVLFTTEDRARGVPDHELAVASADGRAEDDRWQVRKDGTRIWASGVVQPLRAEDGSVLGFAKVLRDRTDVRGQLEALENRVEALARGNARRDLVLATLAHELRSPLAAMSHATELLRLAAGPSDDQRYAVQIVDRQAAAIGRLVDDLLDASRVETGKMAIARVDLDLHEVLARAADAARPRAEQRGLGFRLIAVPGAMPVHGDAGRLGQVLHNLLDNAIKYTPEGGCVWLKATIEGDEAVVRVEDTGIGIEPEALPEIFELFTQEEHARPLSGGGLGLGLSLVRQIVALHDGTVQVRSEGRGKGSEFTVRLPLVRRPAGPETA